MKNDFMNSSEMMERFLDGELNSTQTSELFAELAVNPKLQEEMQTMLKIKDSLKSSKVKAPEHLKAGIMLKTGFEKPTFINQIKADAGFASAIWALLTGKTALATYFILLLGGIGLYFYFNSNAIDNKIEYSSNQINSNNNRNNSKSNNAIAKIESSEDNLINSNEFSNYLAQDKLSSTTSKKISLNKNVNSNFEDLEITNLNNFNNVPENQNPISQIYGSNIVNQIANMNFNKNSNFIQLNNLININQFDFLQNLTLHLKNFNGISSVESRVNDLNSTILNNISIGLMYNVSKNFSVGIEGGLENYSLKYQGFENDILMNYYQNYNAVWGGLAMQYNFEPISYLFDTEPYLRGLLAVSELGPVFKIGAGGKYYLNSNIALTAGIESGWFVYENAGKYFNTNKTGYSIGFVFGF